MLPQHRDANVEKRAKEPVYLVENNKEVFSIGGGGQVEKQEKKPFFMKSRQLSQKVSFSKKKINCQTRRQCRSLQAAIENSTEFIGMGFWGAGFIGSDKVRCDLFGMRLHGNTLTACAQIQKTFLYLKWFSKIHLSIKSKIVFRLQDPMAHIMCTGLRAVICKLSNHSQLCYNK